MSNSLHRICALLVVLVVASGCKTRNPDYCDGAPLDHCDNIDAQSCSLSEQCPASAPICDVGGTGRCVECTSSDAQLCGAAEPICGDDNVCRGCTAHSECADSSACTPTGQCAAPSEVAYVAPGGTGTTAAGCSKGAACPTLADAVGTTKQYIKIATGTVQDDQPTAIERTVTILADPGAKLDRMGDGVILEVRGTGIAVQIYDVEISGATGDPQGIGVLIPPGSTPLLTLVRVTVTRNQGLGISAGGGSLTVAQATISENDGGGVAMNVSGVVTITGSFIHHNGDPATTSFGGLSLRPMGASKVEFNTIVDNQSNLSSTSAGGIFCDTAGFVAANNLIFRNTGGASGRTQTVGDCSYGNSLNMPGTSPSDNSLNFVKPNDRPFDYHLSSMSPSSVVGAAGACSGLDFDGDERPIGGMCDLGADELRQ